MAGRRRKERMGARLVRQLTTFRDVVRAGIPLEKRYTVRTVELELKPKAFTAVDVRALRESLGVSQAVFARIMGISPDLVAAWEQGTRKPVPMACRLLELIEQDRGRWAKILEGAVVGRRKRAG